MMKIDDSELKRFADLLQEKTKVAAVNGIRSALALGWREILVEIEKTSPHKPVDKGHFRAGWRVDQEPDGGSLSANAPHSSFIEYGVRAENVKPNKRLRGALVEWCMRKGLAHDKEHAFAMATVIMRNMQKRGIHNPGGQEGHRYLQTFIEKRLDTVLQEEIQSEIARQLR